MKNIVSQNKLPNELTADELKAIIDLHQQFFSFPAELIKELLLERDYIILYKNKKTHTLIATIGVSEFIINNDVVSYLGNTVIDSAYSQKGLLAHSQLRNAIKLIVKHPFKRKFLCAFTHSQRAYDWAMKSPVFWPNEKQRTPNNMLQLMEAIAIKLAGKSYYRIENDVIIIETLSTLLKLNRCHLQKTELKPNNAYFSIINRYAEMGEQVLLLGPINVINFLHGLYYIFKSLLKKTFWT